MRIVKTHDVLNGQANRLRRRLGRRDANRTIGDGINDRTIIDCLRNIRENIAALPAKNLNRPEPLNRHRRKTTFRRNIVVCSNWHHLPPITNSTLMGSGPARLFTPAYPHNNRRRWLLHKVSCPLYRNAAAFSSRSSSWIVQPFAAETPHLLQQAAINAALGRCRTSCGSGGSSAPHSGRRPSGCCAS